VIFKEPAEPSCKESTKSEFAKSLDKIPKIVGSINHLPEFIYDADQIVNPVKIHGEISALLKDITGPQLQSVIDKVDPKVRGIVKQILIDAKIMVKDSLDDIFIDKADHPPTSNVKKSLLNRYRKQSGICDPLNTDSSSMSVDKVSSSSISGGFQMPAMDVSDKQREAAARALTKWWEEKKHQIQNDTIGLEDLEEASQSNSLAQNVEEGSYRENTVIKVTPQGLRKLTFFDGEFQN